MENRQLGREVDSAKNTIDELVSLVESLEENIRTKDIEIEKLEERIEELVGEISDLNKVIM